MYLQDQKKIWLRYLVVIGMMIGVLFVGFSLFTYNPLDSSWFYISTDMLPVTNACGVMGANCAALLLYMFGGAAFLLFLPLLFSAYVIGRSLPMRDEWERIIAGCCLVISAAALCATYDLDYALSPYPGGLVGLQCAGWLLYFCDPLGRMVFLPMSLTAFLVIFLRFSHVLFVQWVVAANGWCVAMMRKYNVVQRGLYPVRVGLYAVLVKPPLFLCNFIQSLLNGSAFDGTGLVVPEEYTISVASSEFDNLFAQKNTIQDALYRDFSDSYISGVAEKQLQDDEIVDNYTASIKDNDTQDNDMKENITSVSPEEESLPGNVYSLPQLDIFIYNKKVHEDHDLEDELTDRAHILQDKLKRFGVSGEVVAIKRGPVVTLFEYQPDADTKLSKIIALEDDLAMALQAMSIRILAPIPGRAVVGFEVANAKRNDVLFSQLVSTPLYRNFSGVLPLVLGKGTIGEPVVVDLARMPHLLIAGSTGSGKSVALNGLLISLLCKLSPDELKLILIDPKRLEFASFTDIAHLLFPIVTSPHHAAPVLRWVVNEMERRYEKMATKGARNSADYNASLPKSNEHERLPSIVVIIDELADLMLTAGRDIEDLITRITQMARAAGIHMIVATQRPSVDVITGLIKANFPSRISFRVASRIDSRTILDTMGADRLLGRGDMLFLDAATSQLNRVHGAYVSDQEIESVVNHIRAQRKVEYLDIQQEMSAQTSTMSSTEDPLYEEIRLFLDEVDEISISLVQRKFRIGYNRSARIIDVLESQGLIMPQDGGKMRKVIR